ncbi:exopolysaccharide biosynthesis polyprenyl glycosylphosphotransferase [Candidatus Saccharibacteria bacterium]|nr:exopolysaccharide biosynthesis polyprenyl glycosylphosphotransferase [Candidatus Saccharibacteria bacterium]
MKNNASLRYGILLVIGDFLTLVAAFSLAYILRVKLDERPLIEIISARDYLTACLYILPLWIITFGFVGLYSKSVYENRFSEFARLLVGCFLGILVAIGYEYVSNKEIFPARLVPVYSLGLSFVILLLFRTVARGIRRSLFSFGIGVSNVLIVGSSDISSEFIHALNDTKSSGYRIVGIVGKRSKKYDGYYVANGFSGAIKSLENIGINSIIQTELYPDPDKNSEILSYAQENHISYRFVPGNSELFSGNIDVDLFYSLPVIAVHQTALVGWGRVVKRLFDIIIGGMILLISLPLMLLISILIFLFDNGPIFFRQERLSRFNSTVKIFKFRTMKTKYNGLLPEEAFAKMGKPELVKTYRQNGDQLDNDPRVSKIGNLLRSTSLDELPQLINVVCGDISLVGPRALVARDLDRYDKKSLILSVKSGMTGLAVISGRKDLPYEERRKLDLYYVQNWSFWNDIVILARTFAVVLLRRGAK